MSLAASLLRPVDADVTRDELKAFVDEDYRSSGYAARQEKFDEFYAFLKRMHPGDLVVTVSQGDVHFGTITGDAEFVDEQRRAIQPPPLGEVVRASVPIGRIYPATSQRASARKARYST